MGSADWHPVARMERSAIRDSSVRLRDRPGFRCAPSGLRLRELHRRPKHPRRELSAAEIKTLALGRLAGCRFQHQFENALAALLHGFLAIEDGAAIDVHVV